LFSFRPFAWLMRKLYAFVSYNRKVIIPAQKIGGSAIQPAFRLHYRIAYLLFATGIAGLILTNFSGLLTGLLPAGNSYREYGIAGGQLIFQGSIIGCYAPHKAWDYLGNMMTISLAGSLLLLPAMAVASFIHLPQVLTAGYFLLVAGLMLLEHIRRTKLLSLGWVLTVSWVLYRLIALSFILF
jgi:hypothetical protein